MTRILIAEDENVVAINIQEILQKFGYTVVEWVTSGAAAIELAEQERPDLVLIDTDLVGERDGITIGDEIYHQLHIPVVYLAPDAGEHTLKRATITNPFGYILKPVCSDNLQSTIKVALQRHREEVSHYVELQERNQDLEKFQLQLISLLQQETVRAQQASACNQILGKILQQLPLATSESELLHQALQELGHSLNIDYAWIARYDRENNTATIINDYGSESAVVPESAIGQQIDRPLYPQFYRHLDRQGCWVDPPQEIVPDIYVHLSIFSAQMLICPIVLGTDKVSPHQQHTIGEIGILTTGNAPWDLSQVLLITHIFSSVALLFCQTHFPSLNRQSRPLSLQWLNSIKNDFKSSVRQAERDLKTATAMFQQQIRSLRGTPKHPDIIDNHQLWHHQLSDRLQIVKAEWSRRFDLLDTWIDGQVTNLPYQNIPLSNAEFCTWIAQILRHCEPLAQQQHQHIISTITNHLPSVLICNFPMLESIVLELFSNVCKYTPPYQSILLDVGTDDERLKFVIVSHGIEISPTDLASMLESFAPLPDHHSWQHSFTNLGLSLVQQLLPYLNAKLETYSDRDSTSLILTVPI